MPLPPPPIASAPNSDSHQQAINYSTLAATAAAVAASNASGGVCGAGGSVDGGRGGVGGNSAGGSISAKTNLSSGSAGGMVDRGGNIGPPSDQNNLSSTETLLRNIQSLLTVAADNARQQERQISYEKGK